MPDLSFQVTGVEPAARGLVPLLNFKLSVKNEPPGETIQSVVLQAQIQIQAPRRAYSTEAKEKLVELFGTPDRWGQTLRTRLWTQTGTVVRSFAGHTEALLPGPCTFDLNVAATKYFYALEDGEVPLLFLFSGTVFYAAPDGRLQVQQISWNQECEWAMPATTWRELMELHYPNSAWISVHRDLFEQLYAFKRSEGLGTWDDVLQRLLNERPTEALV